MVGQLRKKISEIGEEYGLDSIVKELVGGAVKNAGKSKDDLIHTLGREIGLAWAAVLKEPFEKLLKNKSIQITIELVSKDEKDQTKEDLNAQKQKSKKPKKTKVKAKPAKKKNRQRE